MTRGAAAVALALLAAAAVAVSATAKPPKKAYTPAGTAAAKAIVLKLSDFPPGWKASKGGGSGASVTCPTFDPDQSDLTTIGHGEAGFETTDGLGNVASIVGVFKTAAQAQTSWNRLVRPQLVNCMAGFLESIASGGTTVKVVSKGKLAISLPGKRKAAYRIVANVTAGGQAAKVYLVVLLQGAGAADTVLIVTSVITPPAAPFESGLARAIAGRLPKK
jgi:hypothetical protein